MAGTPKVVVVGGVAGGATAAAKARRMSESAEIVVFERGPYVSFANCGLPYYIGGVIVGRRQLFVTTAERFSRRFNLRIHAGHEVTRIDREAKQVEVREESSGRAFRESYDKLILSPGASPVVPPFPGGRPRNVFTLRTVPDVDAIVSYLEERKPTRAVVVGAGYIGLEVAEALARRGLKLTVVELLPQILPVFDREMVAPIARHLAKKGIDLILEDGVKGFEGEPDATRIELGSGRKLEMDLALLSIGVRPETGLAAECGLALGEHGGIEVDDSMRTSDPDIFAAGDAVESLHLVTGRKVLMPLAGPANKQGRIAGANAVGGNLRFRGVLGTSIVKVFDDVAAKTGLSAREAEEAGYDHFAVHVYANHHAGYYPGAKTLAIKLVVEKGGRLLGAQVVGEEGVDKRIDVFAAALAAGMTAEDLEQLDLAYAPPFGAGVDPVIMAGYVAANVSRGEFVSADPCRMHADLGPDVQIVDVRTAIERARGIIPGAVALGVDETRERLAELDPERRTVFYCATGYRSYFAAKAAAGGGLKKAESLSGGILTWRAAGGACSEARGEVEAVDRGAVPES